MVDDPDVHIICQTPYLSDEEMKEKQIKNKKGDAKHGLIRWEERKQQRKLAGFFIAIPYLKGQILNYQNTKDLKESLMVVDPDVHIICQTP